MSDAAIQAVVETEFNRVRGRLCGLIESWGLPTTQENGAKSTLKYLTYDSQETILEAITDALANE